MNTQELKIKEDEAAKEYMQAVGSVSDRKEIEHDFRNGFNKALELIAKEHRLTKEQFYNSQLKEAYVDLNGNKYLEFINDGAMTYRRFMSAQVNERAIRLGLTPEFLNEAIKKGLDLAFDGNVKERALREAFTAIFMAMKARAGYVVEEDQYIRLACVYFLIEGEPLEEVSEAFTLAKIKLLGENPDAKDFFLQGAIKKTHDLTMASLDVMKDCFAMAKERIAIAPTLPQ